MAEDIVKLLSRPGSPIIVFLSVYPILRGTQQGRKYTGWGNFLRFSTEIPFISELVRDRPMVAMER